MFIYNISSSGGVATLENPEFKIATLETVDATFADLLNLTQKGTLYKLIAIGTDSTTKGELKITIDNISAETIVFNSAGTAGTTGQEIYLYTPYNASNKYKFNNSATNGISIYFKSSIKLEARLSAGIGTFKVKVFYGI